MKSYEMSPKGSGAGSPSAKSFELLPSGAGASGAASKGGCGAGCGCTNKRTSGTGAPIPPMAAHMRTVLEETGRVLQKMPGADPTGGLGRMFQALQAMTDDLLQQVENPPKR